MEIVFKHNPRRKLPRAVVEQEMAETYDLANRNNATFEKTEETAEHQV